MAAKIIDGKKIAEEMQKKMVEEILILKNAHGRVPGLAVVLVGENPASQVYVKNKEKSCEKVGIYSEAHRLPATTDQKTLLKLIDDLNNNPKINGILVQLPLPKHLDEKTLLNAIKPEKDVDGFHPVNVGKLLIGEKGFRSCTPFGVMKMLEFENIDISGMHAVVIGRSNIVGKPIAVMLLEKNATVTICHSKTKDLSKVIASGDIIIAAIGKPEMIKADMIKPGAIVIDVGINRLDNGKLVGDVAFAEAAEKASYITPVPGGVGPMTITMLLFNAIESFKNTL